MAILFQCSGCKRKVKANDHLAGKRVKCPSCGQPTVVPVPSPASQANMTRPSPGELRVGSPGSPMATRVPRTRRAMRPWCVAGVATALCLVLGLAFAFAIRELAAVKPEPTEVRRQSSDGQTHTPAGPGQNCSPGSPPLIPRGPARPPEAAKTEPEKRELAGLHRQIPDRPPDDLGTFTEDDKRPKPPGATVPGGPSTVTPSKPTPQPEPRKTEPESLDGQWYLVGCEMDGKKTDWLLILALGTSVKIEGTKLSEVKAAGSAYETWYEGTVKIAPKSDPKEIDLCYQSKSSGPLGEVKGVWKGIYKFENDHLVVCVSDPGKDRPREFKTRPKNGTELWFYNRTGVVSRSLTSDSSK